MTGICLFDVFSGSGFLATTAHHLGLRGHLLDTKFGPRYAVTMLLVLTRIRQDVSAGKCFAGMISRPRQHTSCSCQVISATASVTNLLHRARMPWILEHPCDSCLWSVPKIQALAAQLRTAQVLADFSILGSSSKKAAVISGGNVDSRDLNRIARKCAGTGRRCRVSVQKQFHSKASASHSEVSSSRDHTRPLRLSVALAIVLTMHARRFQRTHALSGIIASQRVKGYWYGRYRSCAYLWIRINDGTRCRLQWMAQLALVLNYTQDLVTRTDLPTYAPLATHDSLSLKMMMSSSCTLITFAEQYKREAPGC